MVYRGWVKNGKIELDGGAVLPDGTAVEVSVREGANGAEDKSIPTLYEQLAPVIGQAEGLPPDLSINHDHYLYGTPKRL